MAKERFWLAKKGREREKGCFWSVCEIAIGELEARRRGERRGPPSGNQRGQNKGGKGERGAKELLE